MTRLRSIATAATASLALGLTLGAAPALAAGEVLTGGPVGPTNDATPTFTWTATGAAACSLDGAAPVACTSPWTVSPELADGPHVVEVTAGGMSEARSFGVDTVVPAVRITAGDDGTVTEPTATFSFTAEDGADVACAIDTGAFAACTSPWTTPALRNGTHSVRVRATDAAGNTAETSRVVVMDVTSPDTTIASGPGEFTDERRPAFAFTSSRAGGSFICKLDDAPAVPCGPAWQPDADLALGAHRLAVSAVDAAGNADVTPAERAFTIASCDKTASLGAVEIAADCLRNVGDSKLQATGPVKLNGITFNPRRAAGQEASVTIDTTNRTITFPEIQLRMGSIVLYQGDLEFGVPEGDSFVLATIDLETKRKLGDTSGDGEAALDLEGDDDAQAAGFPLKGKAKLELSKGQAILTASIELPAVFTDAEGNGLTGFVQITSDNAHGVRLDKARVTAPLAYLGSVEVQNLSVAFIGANAGAGSANPTCNTPSPGLRWEGSASVIVLPTADKTQLTDAAFGFADGRFAHASATWKPGGAGADLGGGVKLTKLGVSICAGPPLRLMGRAGITAMPGEDGKPRLEIPDAGLIFTGAHDGKPWTIRAEAPEAKLGGDIPLAFKDLFVQVSAAGAVDFGGGVHFEVPLKGKGDVAELDAAVAVDATAKGFIEGSQWSVELSATGCFNGTFKISDAPSVPFSNICPGIEGLVSSTGFAVCGSLKVGDKSLGRIGAGKRWDGDLKFMSSSCDIGPWRVSRPEAQGARAARLGAGPTASRLALGEAPVDIPAGKGGVLVALRGVDGPPQVTLRSPNGTAVVTSPADADGAVETGRATAFTNVAAKTTYVALRSPRGGTWTATPVRPGDAIAEASAAAMLAQAKVRARVTGGDKGRGPRILRFEVGRRAGQTVRFVERGEGVATTIAVIRSGGVGVKAFRPATGPAGKRTIVALVEQDGAPRESRDVATFRAAAPAPAARPAGVRVARSSTRATSTLVITWKSATRAQRYGIRVELADGRVYAFARGARDRRVELPGIARSTAAAVRVVGLRDDADHGRAGTARLKAGAVR